MPPKRLSHDDYRVGWICALEVEQVAAMEMLDEEHDFLPQPSSDTNFYNLGSINNHNVVIAGLPRAGNCSAATVVTQMKMTFPNLKYGLLVGIGGGVPIQTDHGMIRLGHVVVSEPTGIHSGAIQYDYEKAKVGHFERKGCLAPPPTALLNAAREVAVQRQRSDHDPIWRNTQRIKTNRPALRRFNYPGAANDHLYQRNYEHRQQGVSCEECGCDPNQRIERPLDDNKESFIVVHRGTIASGELVIKDAKKRDDLAKEYGVLCFEMEAAGALTDFPCIVVRGISDYCDSHKNDMWHGYAAAVAAAYARQLFFHISIEEARRNPSSNPTTFELPFSLAEVSEVTRFLAKQAGIGRVQEAQGEIVGYHTGAIAGQGPGKKRHWMVPFGRNTSFVGRDAILERILAKVPPDAVPDDCQRVVLEGLGGVGKTQIALETAFRIRDQHGDCSVFWVPAIDRSNFENAYREIGSLLGLDGMKSDDTDPKALVQTALSQQSAGKWLLIIDNADDPLLLCGNSNTAETGDAQDRPLLCYLPFSASGSIFFTTRNHEVSVDLDTPEYNILKVEEMQREESLKLLMTTLKESQVKDMESTNKLLDLLENLPLAIRQASALIAKKQLTTAEYLDVCLASEDDLINLLSRDFEDRQRYKSTKNPVATTWLISFQHIETHNQLAADFFKFMCFLTGKDIPLSLLPPARKIEVAEAIGTLKAYAFITQREDDESFDLHRLVRLAMMSWLRGTGELEAQFQQWTTKVMERLAAEFPNPEHRNRNIWTRYLPHVHHFLHFRERRGQHPAEALLQSRIGSCLYTLGRFPEAERAFRLAQRLLEDQVGPEHEDSLSCMHEVGLMLLEQEKLEDAEQVLQRTMSLKEKALGRNHLQTLCARRDHFRTLTHLKRFEEAEGMGQPVLESFKKELGDRHPDTLKCASIFAFTLSQQHRYYEAEQIEKPTLALRKTVLGVDHPMTLVSANNLAFALSRQGKYEEAEEIERETLKLRETSLGKEHPNTLASMNNLAITLAERGKPDEALVLMKACFALSTRVLGVDNPETKWRGEFVRTGGHRAPAALHMTVAGTAGPEGN